jgi:hypothetical protein
MSLIDLQSQNLFDLPIQDSQDSDNQFNEDNFNMTGGDNIIEPQDPQLFNSITKEPSPLEVSMSDKFKLSGGSYQPQQSNNASQLLQPQAHPQPQPSQSSSQLLQQIQEPNVQSQQPHPLKPQQTGGMTPNIEDFENVDLEIQETGNLDNPSEDAPSFDNDKFDEQVEEPKELQPWVHPELNIEEDPEMIIKMSQDDIDNKVSVFVDNYNSHEYQEYMKYFQSFYSASSQKYSIRRDSEGNIYLIRRNISKELKGKKVRETIAEIMNDKDFKTNYLIKLTPPEYFNVHEELLNITKQLNILSGDIKMLQNDLIELGSEITKDDVKRFEKSRQKFYKLINKKYIYSKYYDIVNNVFEEESTQSIYAKEIVPDTDENDIKIYKLKYHVVKAPNSLVEDMTNQIKNNLENYSQIINDEGNNMKEYNTKIKNFIETKKENENKIQKELTALVNISKSKVDFIIRKLPKIDIKSDPFST